jgi:hypothetical protein
MACCSHPVRLSRSNTVLVDRCTCGSVHVTLGHVTLHVDENSFFAVAEELHRSAERLAALRAEASRPVLWRLSDPGDS